MCVVALLWRITEIQVTFLWTWLDTLHCILEIFPSVLCTAFSIHSIYDQQDICRMLLELCCFLLLYTELHRLLFKCAPHWHLPSPTWDSIFFLRIKLSVLSTLDPGPSVSRFKRQMIMCRRLERQILSISPNFTSKCSNLDILDRSVSLPGLGTLALDLHSYWPRSQANKQPSQTNGNFSLTDIDVGIVRKIRLLYKSYYGENWHKRKS